MKADMVHIVFKCLHAGYVVYFFLKWCFNEVLYKTYKFDMWSLCVFRKLSLAHGQKHELYQEHADLTREKIQYDKVF